MIEKTVVSFGYIPESKLMRTSAKSPTETTVMNYSTFEESYLQKQQSKISTKRNSRRRVEQARNTRRCSDAGSDTGSDGVAVNSGGSGRSGDWGPPKIRQKPKYSRRRNEQQRASFTDSGISLAKTDSGDFTELACHANPSFDKGNLSIQRGYSDNSHERCHNKLKHVEQQQQQQQEQQLLQNQQRKSRSSSNPGHPKNLQEGAMKRSSSCSALPSNIKPLDRHNPRIPSRDIHQRLDKQRNPAEIEAKENAILEQCLRNEGVSTECLEQHCSYIVDCIHGAPSKFPLPERLNYPLNKYYKSDTNLNRINLTPTRMNIHPLKKIRSSIRKLKSKTPSILSTPDRYEHYMMSSTSINDDTLDTMDSSYLNYLTESENSEAIMARLAKSPSSRKAWLKKVFKWKKLGKTYTAKHDTEKNKTSESIIYSESPNKSLNARSHSTRSIPDAIKQMWTKLHDMPTVDGSKQQSEPQSTTPNLTRATSMPSISTNRISKQKVGDVIYFNEKGFEQSENKNIFQNFFKPMENQTPRTPLKGGNDVITSVLGCDKMAVKKSLNDAELSHGKDDLFIRNENNNQITLKQEPEKKPVPQFYTSCQDLRAQQSHQTSVGYHPMAYPSTGHCPCCGHGQVTHREQYMEEREMYDPHFQQYSYNGIQHGHPDKGFVQPSAYYAPPIVVAPLDVKVSSERKAERRKICEMVFDTFV